MMAQQWYYANGDQSVGPLTQKQLLELARSGTITRSTLITVAGANEWIAAERVDGVFPKPSSTIPAPPPPRGPAVASVTVAQTPVPTIVPSPSQSRSMVIAIAVIAGVVICLGAGVGAVLLYQRSGAIPPHAAETPATAQAASKSGTHNEDAEDALEKLRQEKRRVQSDVEDLKRERDKLSREIKDLGAKFEQLHKWKSVRFALVNPTHFAVGLEVTADNEFSVVCKAEEADAETAVRVAGKSGIQRIASNPALTRSVYRAASIGKNLSHDLAGQIKKYWKEHRYVEHYSPDDIPIMVTFTDLASGLRRVGFYHNETDSTLQFQGVSPKSDTIRRELIQPGSAKRAQGDGVLPNLSEVEFLDYCVLMVAQKIGSREGEEGHRDIAIKMKFDVLEEAMKFSKTPDNEKVDIWAALFMRLANQDIATDGRKNPVRHLREAAMAVENEMYEKCVRMGLPVVEREKGVLDLVLEERQLSSKNNGEGKKSEFEAHDYAQLHCATHIVLLEPALARAGGEYALNVRLVSVDTGRVLWAMQGERVGKRADAGKETTQYLLRSGRAGIVTFNQKSKPADFIGIEDPAIVLPFRIKGGAPALTYVVHVESDQGRDVTYRPLFGKQVLSIPRATIVKLEFPRDIDDVPHTHPDQLRCIVWHIAKGLLPPAGHVHRNNAGRVIAAVGRNVGISPQTRFRVVRPMSSSVVSVDRQLPVEFAVSHIQDGDCELVAIAEAALTGTGTADELAVADGDIAIAQNSTVRAVLVEVPQLTEPRPHVRKRMLHNGKLELKWAQKTKQTAAQLQERIGAGLRQLGIAVEQPASAPVAAIQRRQSFPLSTGSTPDPATHTTHTIAGTITVASESVYHVDLDVKERATATVLDHVEFDISDVQLN